MCTNSMYGCILKVGKSFCALDYLKNIYDVTVQAWDKKYNSWHGHSFFQLLGYFLEHFGKAIRYVRGKGD